VTNLIFVGCVIHRIVEDELIAKCITCTLTNIDNGISDGVFDNMNRHTFIRIADAQSTIHSEQYGGEDNGNDDKNSGNKKLSHGHASFR
jgi:hypothetical protein